MHVQWFGQSAFRLAADGITVAIDPFGSMEAAQARGMRFAYPPISDLAADLALVTHEHFDHNAVEAVDGDPTVLRSTAGTLESPAGEVVAVASEHDDAAGTRRGPNTIFVFSVDGTRVCHFGDFGQSDLRPEQQEAIGTVDLLFLPVGGGPTIDGPAAAQIARRLAPRWVVPMHYRTPAVDFLGPIDGFLEGFDATAVRRLDEPSFDTGALDAAPYGSTVVVPAAPGG